jgi:hypothetical protein
MRRSIITLSLASASDLREVGCGAVRFQKVQCAVPVLPRIEFLRFGCIFEGTSSLTNAQC